MMSVLGVDEFAPTSDFLKEVIGIACDQEALTQPLCLSVISLISGYGSDQVNKTMVPVILGHVPAGAAVLQVIHYAQVINASKFSCLELWKNTLPYTERKYLIHANKWKHCVFFLIGSTKYLSTITKNIYFISMM